MLCSNAYKGNAASHVEAFLKRIEGKYGVLAKDATIAAFYKQAKDNFPASWLIAIKGGDISVLKKEIEKGEMQSQNNQNIIIYKGPHFYMAEINGIKLIGSKDFIIYAMGDDGFSIVSAYMEAGGLPFRMISDSPKLMEQIFGFLKPVYSDANRPVKNITSINAKYFPDKKEIELTANYFVDQINQATVVYKFDSEKLDWERFIRMLGEAAGVEGDKIKDEAAEAGPAEEDALKYNK
jgi:hypothetical protein